MRRQFYRLKKFTNIMNIVALTIRNHLNKQIQEDVMKYGELRDTRFPMSSDRIFELHQYGLDVWFDFITAFKERERSTYRSVGRSLKISSEDSFEKNQKRYLSQKRMTMWHGQTRYMICKYTGIFWTMRYRKVSISDIVDSRETSFSGSRINV